MSEESGTNRYAILLTAVFLVICGFAISRHEMWRDEIQAWLVARDSASLLDLFRNLKYEDGAPLTFELLVSGPDASHPHFNEPGNHADCASADSRHDGVPHGEVCPFHPPAEIPHCLWLFLRLRVRPDKQELCPRRAVYHPVLYPVRAASFAFSCNRGRPVPSVTDKPALPDYRDDHGSRPVA